MRCLEDRSKEEPLFTECYFTAHRILPFGHKSNWNCIESFEKVLNNISVDVQKCTSPTLGGGRKKGLDAEGNFKRLSCLAKLRQQITLLLPNCLAHWAWHWAKNARAQNINVAHYGCGDKRQRITGKTQVKNCINASKLQVVLLI